MAKDEEYYSYELDKPMLGKIMKDTVGIRPSWLWRIRRYAGTGGMDLKKIYRFINNGLQDSRTTGFEDKALDGTLSKAQKWVLMHLFLKGGVPEFIRDKAADEDLPELVEAEEAPKTTGIVGSVASTATGVASGVVGAATAPVRSLTDMMTGKKDSSSEDSEDGE